MKIAVFGWYGHNNAGDERIKFCLNHFLMSLGGIENIDFFDLHEYAIKGATNQFDHYDLLIVGGGGLILSRYNYHDFILGIKTKLITIGISVETELKGNPKKFVLALLEKSKFFLVRDSSSAEKIYPFDIYKKVKISSDLTFLRPYNSVKIENNNLIGINLLPKPKDFKYSTLSIPIFAFVLSNLARIGFPNALRTIDFQEVINKLKQEFNILPIPLCCTIQDAGVPVYQKNDVEFLKTYFSKVSENFCDALIDQVSVFLSMRLHGSIFAVQKGIPVVSFSYLPKNKNFMKEVGLEEFVLEHLNPNNIHELLLKSLKHKELIRQKMLLFTEKACKKICNDLINIINLIK